MRLDPFKNPNVSRDPFSLLDRNSEIHSKRWFLELAEHYILLDKLELCNQYRVMCLVHLRYPSYLLQIFLYCSTLGLATRAWQLLYRKYSVGRLKGISRLMVYCLNKIDKNGVPMK